MTSQTLVLSWKVSCVRKRHILKSCLSLLQHLETNEEAGGEHLSSPGDRTESTAQGGRQRGKWEGEKLQPQIVEMEKPH